MVDRAEREPTMDEIVVALRETRRAAGRSAPFTVVDGQRSDKSLKAAPADDAQSATGIVELRDNEIRRLLIENARLNERVMFLLKVIERERPHDRADAVATELSGDALLNDLKATLEAELRPVLDVMLRLVEKLHAPAIRGPHSDGGIIDLDAPRAHE
jgi:hypothetical protein